MVCARAESYDAAIQWGGAPSRLGFLHRYLCVQRIQNLAHSGAISTAQS